VRTCRDTARRRTELTKPTRDLGRAGGDGDPARRPTLRDVARLANVDTSTASRVLRDDPNQGVRDETRDRILDAARVLHYRANAVAQSLRTRRTDTVAVIVPSLDNPGFVDVIRGIQAEAAAAGKLVLLVEADAAAGADGALAGREELFARLVLDGRADGLIAAFSTLEPKLVARISASGLPLVLVNRRLAGVPGSVAVDDVRAARLAVQHLVDLGHTRIGFVGFSEIAKRLGVESAGLREQGFREAISAAGLRVDPRWTADAEPSKAGGQLAVGEILAASPREACPTAVFCTSLLSAVGALAAFRERGIAVPGEMSVVAFNDHEIANDTAPPLTTVRLPTMEMGREALRMVMRAADGVLPTHEIVEGPIEVIPRVSTASPGG
jgi:LacI family transcriptional regulator